MLQIRLLLNSVTKADIEILYRLVRQATQLTGLEFDFRQGQAPV